MANIFNLFSSPASHTRALSSSGNVAKRRQNAVWFASVCVRLGKFNFPLIERRDEGSKNTLTVG